MSYTLLLHVANEDPVLVEVDDLPDPKDTWIKGSNPRRKDGKDLHYIMPDVTVVLFPAWRINFIELMPGDADEEIVTTVRTSTPRY